ncbi:hypothetical protein RB7563 [Rhodopirellula baltica SH 1]|uniref:Uncharacterized protein n=1 Tax=Rhodopirellula baltica (strain DSM 10527 / NCIMB 13988 / SH1) TaxID=243090 RepID=Q7UNI6_RHOBA|nr:hypothetical protein RB7563 [Rhodopirellula baltica SH 1]
MVRVVCRSTEDLWVEDWRLGEMSGCFAVRWRCLASRLSAEGMMSRPAKPAMSLVHLS